MSLAAARSAHSGPDSHQSVRTSSDGGAIDDERHGPRGPPPYRYTAALAAQIEARWQERWEREGTFRAANPSGALSDGFARVAGRAKYYLNDMFPYPSGAGLHVGHPLGYIGTDVLGRYLRMNGYNVLHTMGFDAFGLPAEQYAIETGQHPRATTAANIDTYRRQLRRLGLGHDPRRSVVTLDTGFYRWTQWIFLQMFEAWYDEAAGRARPIAALIADFDAGIREPVPGRQPVRPAVGGAVADGATAGDRQPPTRLPRRGARQLVPGAGHRAGQRGGDRRGPQRARQLSRLPPATEAVDAADHHLCRAAAERSRAAGLARDRQDMQRNWIGRSTGARIRFSSPAGDIEVFTTRPDTIFGATFIVLASEHQMVGALTTPAWPVGTREAWTSGAATPHAPVTTTGRFTGSWATESGERREDSGVRRRLRADGLRHRRDHGGSRPGRARLGSSPSSFDLPIVRTVEPPADFTGKAYAGEGPAINSGFLNGLGVTEAGQRIVAWLEEHGAGGAAVTYRLRDWLFSRQRYWGEPFPIVYDESGLPLALPATLLPVELPDMADFAPPAYDPDDADSEPQPPLGRATEWARVALDLGEGPKTYRRELNTMPQWAGSCWYEIRYLDPANGERFVDADVERYWMGPQAPGDPGGVDLYVGGVEHAVLHLLYARFWQKVLFDLGLVSASEPFRRLFNQGLVQAHAYTDERGIYVPAAGGGGARRWIQLARPAGHPPVWLDGQEPQELRHTGRDVRRLRRRHAACVRDVHRTAGSVPPVGDPCGRRLPPAPATHLARGDR